MNFADRDYIMHDPFSGDRDVDIRCRTVKVVTVRKVQKCISPDLERVHKIKPGTRARVERAIVDGEWGAYYVCLACMDKWLKSEDIEPVKWGNEI